MSSREGQVWEMGSDGTLFLVLRPPDTARQVLIAAGDRNPGRSKVLDRMLWHPVLFLETGTIGGLTEERPGAWDKSKSWRRHL